MYCCLHQHSNHVNTLSECLSLSIMANPIFVIMLDHTNEWLGYKSVCVVVKDEITITLGFHVIQTLMQMTIAKAKHVLCASLPKYTCMLTCASLSKYTRACLPELEFTQCIPCLYRAHILNAFIRLSTRV